MEDELAILRKLVLNPFSRTHLQVYCDFLQEHGREEELAEIQRVLSCKHPGDVNGMCVGELIGVLLSMPLDVPVLYRMCSDWQPMDPAEVTLHQAEQRRIIFLSQDSPRKRFQHGNRYTDYKEHMLQGDEQYEFVTVCTFPGN